jgi:Acetyltransferase (GNAT) domain
MDAVNPILPPEIAPQGAPRDRLLKDKPQPALSIFDEDWWLDAACPCAWDRAKVVWDGELVGEMAYHVRRRWGLTYLRMPHLTRTMSPRLYAPPGKAVTRDINNATIVTELLKKLPRHDRFERALNPRCPSLQGFVHAHLAVTHMFTFRSAVGDGPEMMLKQAHGEARRAINKAQRDCEVERSMDLDRFIRLHHQSYGDGTLVDYPTLRRLVEAAGAKGQAEIVFVRLNGAADTAAMIVIWDKQVAYTWLLARDAKQNYVGATSLLTFEAMRTAHRLGCILDLDGYVNPKVGAFLMKFGLPPVARPYVNNSTAIWKGLRATTTLLNPRRPDRHFRVP